MRFVADGEGGYRPLKGYHGSLVVDVEATAIDFFAKNGNRYHYLPAGDGVSILDYIVDPNGNVTDLIYETLGASDPRLIAVQDSVGRRLAFSYDKRAFRLWTGDVITKITGPEGLVLNYEYDIYGNLIKASRELHGSDLLSRSEQYDYERDNTAPIEDRSLLTSATDLVSGVTTASYRYVKGAIGLQGDVLIPVSHIFEVEKPEGGVYSFEFDPLLISSGDASSSPLVSSIPGDKETAVHPEPLRQPPCDSRPERERDNDGLAPRRCADDLPHRRQRRGHHLRI